ncbi:MAG TPA: pyridoxamine 5'-phosphate oxidase [Gemmatimonadales bacterium]|nr:pyridoxamine 5'-phosphate oxidase [Gemmatimonadales bacterium]
MADLAQLRRDYRRARLDVGDLDVDPVKAFERWFAEAEAVEAVEPNAMALATADEGGAPSVRMVLLKGVDPRGFVFFTDRRSAKGSDLAINPHAALLFWWPELERQVRVTGAVSRTTDAESEAYYRSRPLGSRLGAWASEQSAVIESRGALETAAAQAADRHGDDPPLPPHWGGYRVTPEVVEFWQGREDRLHDRLRYRREGGKWVVERLSP